MFFAQGTEAGWPRQRAGSVHDGPAALWRGAQSIRANLILKAATAVNPVPRREFLGSRRCQFDMDATAYPSSGR